MIIVAKDPLFDAIPPLADRREQLPAMKIAAKGRVFNELPALTGHSRAHEGMMLVASVPVSGAIQLLADHPGGLGAMMLAANAPVSGAIQPPADRPEGLAATMLAASGPPSGAIQLRTDRPEIESGPVIENDGPSLGSVLRNLDRFEAVQQANAAAMTALARHAAGQEMAGHDPLDARERALVPARLTVVAGVAEEVRTVQIAQNAPKSRAKKPLTGCKPWFSTATDLLCRQKELHLIIENR
jgi:hypothetical protein